MNYDTNIISESSYICDDIIIYIGELCDFHSLISLHKTSKFVYSILIKSLNLRLENIPWRLCIEYNTKNTMTIHNIWLNVGYITEKEFIHEKCSICSTGIWRNHKDQYVCSPISLVPLDSSMYKSSRRQEYCYTNKHVKFIVYHGKLKGLIDYIRNTSIVSLMFYIDNEKKSIKLINMNDNLVHPANGYCYFEEVKINIVNLNEIVQFDIDYNKIFEEVKYGHLPYNADMMTSYCGYTLDFIKSSF